MHIIVTSWGSSGDVLPPIAIGWELRRRGYPVTFMGNSYFESSATQAGLAFVEVGTLADYERVMVDAGMFDRSIKDPEQLLVDHILPYVETYFEASMANFVAGQTLVVGGGLGPFFAAEKLGIPFVTVACSPGTHNFNSRYDPIHHERVLPEWARWFTRSGRRLALFYRLSELRRGNLRQRSPKYNPVPAALLKSRPIAGFRSRIGLSEEISHQPTSVCMWPDWFAAPQPDWPPEMTIAGFPFYPRPILMSGDAPGHPAEPLHSRPIVFTTGSIASSQARFFATAVEACRILKCPAILVTPHQDHIPRNLPDNIRHLAFAPFNELFARASLLVHHGGIGTASYALAAGIPQIVMPMRGDQFDNGNRLTRLGVARMFAARQTSGAKLAQAIEFMLGSKLVAGCCEHWQSKIDLDAGLDIAANYIESLAESTRV